MTETHRLQTEYLEAFAAECGKTVRHYPLAHDPQHSRWEIYDGGSSQDPKVIHLTAAETIELDGLSKSLQRVKLHQKLLRVLRQEQNDPL